MPHFAQFADAFPFRHTISLDRLIAVWKSHSENPDSPYHEAARCLFDNADALQALSGSHTTTSFIEGHERVFKQLMTAVFPLATSNSLYAAAFAPYELVSIYETEAFSSLNLVEGFAQALTHEAIPIGTAACDLEQMMHVKTMRAYHHILAYHYEADVQFDADLVLPVSNGEKGLMRYFNVQIDTDFMDIAVVGEKPRLLDKTLTALLAAPLDFELWRHHLPIECFEFRGFAVMHATEVTEQAILSALKDDLLQRDAMTQAAQVDRLETRLRSLLHCPDLRLGLLGLRADSVDALPQLQAIGRSLLMHDGTLPSCPARYESSYAQTFGSADPVLIHDLEETTTQTGYEATLRAQGLRSLALIPLHANGDRVGIMELASPNPNQFQGGHLHRIEQTTPLFATAMSTLLSAQEDRLQAIIKRQYTAIHPVVEWRFRQAARNYSRRRANDEHAEQEAIVFDNVWPLYGLSDIRGSSSERNTAIQADLLTQLDAALRIVATANSVQQLPALDEIGFRISQYAAQIEAELATGDEAGALDFLRSDIEPLFDELLQLGPDVRDTIAQYQGLVNAELGFFYDRRKAYEASVTMINDRIAQVLEREDQRAQTMFPHYFEKYQTDGVDYNIYIGASLQKNGRFSPLYLHNLRLWQLIATCSIVWEMEGLYPHLPIPLQTAHLILAQSSPLAIRFRIDEKKFDVDGAYNVRYEIIKKRIDKAVIRGTDERLTQPGRVAIVYAQARMADEYRRYLHYLAAKGYIETQVEDVALEDMQGVSGLRALRVKVASAPPSTTLEELLAERTESV